VLEVRNITLSLDNDGEKRTLLDDVSFTVPSGHLLAIVGPSGCGKTTLMKIIAGLKMEDEGEIRWQGRNLAVDGDLHPSELGYVPQFSIAHDLLTIEECVASAVVLRTSQADAEAEDALIEKSLKSTGLAVLSDRMVKVLSGGQKRRLGLALELVTDPTLLLCDEVTSGLDPKSEREITQLLHDLARKNPSRIVINVTHSLTNLSLYDSILVMHEGRVVYHGPPRAVSHYFSVEQAEDIYPKLARRSSERWRDSWKRHRNDYYKAYGFPVNAEEGESISADAKLVADREPGRESLPSARGDDESETEGTDSNKLSKKQKDGDEEEEEEVVERASKKKKKSAKPAKAPIHEISEENELPGIITQTHELVRRRWVIFKRDTAQVWLHALMLLGFPLLVVIFGLEGIPQVRNLSSRQDLNVIAEFKQQTDHFASQLKAGGLVSGLIMLQVVLVTLMASHNAAREIAGERDILERERMGGLRPFAYIMSKIIFLGTFVLAQSLWMGLFVEMVCPGIPGNILFRLLLLVLASAAMTSICLGISGVMRSPEKATILCIYLVGFQLPLSGAVLKLPQWLEPIVRPFIAAYWGWAGSLSTMKATAFFDAVKTVAASAKDAPAPTVALFVLSTHVAVGLVMSYVGVKRSQWD